MFLEFAVEQGRGEIVEFTSFGQQGRGSQAVVIAVIAAILFPVNYILNKPLHFIAFLVNHTQIDLPRVGLQSLLAFEAFSIGMDIMPVKEAHDIQTAGF